MTLRELVTGPAGHVERVDGRGESTNGRLYVDDAGAVHWRSYDDAPPRPGMGPATMLNGLQESCEDVEPALGPRTAADDAARLAALRDAGAQP